MPTDYIIICMGICNLEGGNLNVHMRLVSDELQQCSDVR